MTDRDLVQKAFDAFEKKHRMARTSGYFQEFLIMALEDPKNHEFIRRQLERLARNEGKL